MSSYKKKNQKLLRGEVLETLMYLKAKFYEDEDIISYIDDNFGILFDVKTVRKKYKDTEVKEQILKIREKTNKNLGKFFKYANSYHRMDEIETSIKEHKQIRSAALKPSKEKMTVMVASSPAALKKKIGRIKVIENVKPPDLRVAAKANMEIVELIKQARVECGDEQKREEQVVNSTLQGIIESIGNIEFDDDLSEESFDF